MNAVYGTCVQIMLKLFILPGGRKAIRAIWKLPFRTHCNLLHGINDTLPIDVMLEQKCMELIWTLLQSPNIIVKSVMRSAIRNGYTLH